MDEFLGWLFLLLLCVPIVKLYILVDGIDENQLKRKQNA